MSKIFVTASGAMYEIEGGAARLLSEDPETVAKWQRYQKRQVRWLDLKGGE